MQTLHFSYPLPSDTLSSTNGALMNILLAVLLGTEHEFLCGEYPEGALFRGLMPGFNLP